MEMRALMTAAIYFGTFIALGLFIRFLIHKRMGDVDLKNVRDQAGHSPRKRFLLGIWRRDDD
jgi:hypothetical protein